MTTLKGFSNKVRKTNKQTTYTLDNTVQHASFSFVM